jgi:hypothetical protein
MQIRLPLLAAAVLGLARRAAQAGPQVRLDTSLGPSPLELADDKAPKSVENFLAYARDGFYNGTIFHRVIDGFMIQGGGFTADFQQKPTRAPVAERGRQRPQESARHHRHGAHLRSRTPPPPNSSSTSRTTPLLITVRVHAAGLGLRGVRQGHRRHGHVWIKSVRSPPAPAAPAASFSDVPYHAGHSSNAVTRCYPLRRPLPPPPPSPADSAEARTRQTVRHHHHG